MNHETSIYHRLQVTAVISETPEAKTFELKPLDGWQAVYEAGQFITFVFKKKGNEDRRSYSFSSAPVLQEPMRVTVKRVANGEYSRHLFNHIAKGDRLTSSGIAGYFRLPDTVSNGHQLFFFAAGAGITPVYSLIKTALHSTPARITLVYSNRHKTDTIFYAALLQLAETFRQRFTIEFLFSHAEEAAPVRLSKVLINALLEKYRPPLQQSWFYICGPENYMLMTGISLITAGVPPGNIRKENFNTRKPVIKPLPPDTAAHRVRLSINESVYDFMAQYPDTILAAAKKLNIQLPYSCEAGNCGSCTATCTRGKIWMAYNEVLMENEIAAGKLLTCQGYPVGGDIEIRF